MGQLEVLDIIPAAPHSTERVLELAAAIESGSEHPIGEAIIQAAQKANLSWQPATHIQAKTGLGIVGEVAGARVTVGKATESPCSAQLKAASNSLETAGKTVVWVSDSQEVIGLIAVADTIKPEAANAIASLKQLGITATAMLTGDNQRTASWVAHILIILNFFEG